MTKAKTKLVLNDVRSIHADLDPPLVDWSYFPAQRQPLGAWPKEVILTPDWFAIPDGERDVTLLFLHHKCMADPERSPTAAIKVLREFVEDVKLAHGTGDGDAIDGAGLNWPDLTEIGKRWPSLTTQGPLLRQKVFVATFEHKHGTDRRVFRTQPQAEAWRCDVADMGREMEFEDFPRHRSEHRHWRGLFRPHAGSGREVFQHRTDLGRISPIPIE